MKRCKSCNVPETDAHRPWCVAEVHRKIKETSWREGYLAGSSEQPFMNPYKRDERMWEEDGD